MLLSRQHGEACEPDPPALHTPSAAHQSPEDAPAVFQILRENEAGDQALYARPAPKALWILDPATLDIVYGPDEQRDLRAMASFYAPPQTRESIARDLSLLGEVEVIFSGWGAPPMDEAFLNAAPNLNTVFYAAGSVRSFITPAFWRRGITVTCAADANAEPVAEYTLATILLSLKSFWKFAAGTRQGLGWEDHTRPVVGAYRSTIGLISCGIIARKVLARLATYDVHCIVYDPFLSAHDAAALGVECCSLAEVFARADVVSLHTPELPETLGLITGELLASMKPGATFINTARGAVVRETELIEVMRNRPDLHAVLDVCDPEPPKPDAALLSLPNVVLTPHIAGSMGRECRRLGRSMVDELRRYRAGEPLRWKVSDVQFKRSA